MPFLCSTCKRGFGDLLEYIKHGCTNVATSGDVPHTTTTGLANTRQVGGEHYKTGGEEHWDRVWRLYGRGYFVGCITKYVERYHKKGGVQDLEKAQHFLQKLIELERTAGADPVPNGYVNQD